LVIVCIIQIIYKKAKSIISQKTKREYLLDILFIVKVALINRLAVGNFLFAFPVLGLVFFRRPGFLFFGNCYHMLLKLTLLFLPRAKQKLLSLLFLRNRLFLFCYHCFIIKIFYFLIFSTVIFCSQNFC
jgi:hypothetical protein